MCDKSYYNTACFDEVIAKIKWWRFFDSHGNTQTTVTTRLNVPQLKAVSSATEIVWLIPVAACYTSSQHDLVEMV